MAGATPARLAPGAGPPGGYGSVPASEAERLADYVDRKGWQPYHNRIVFFVALLKFFGGSCVGGLPFVIEELQKEFNADRATIATVASGLLFGALLGAFVGGSFSDSYGRRKQLISSALLGATAAALHFAVVHLWQLFLLRLLLGVAFGSIVVGMNVYLVEFMPSDTRGWCICAASLGWKAGTVYAGMLPWAIRGNWRLILAGPLPPGLIAATVYLCSAPESPRFLFVAGRDEEALTVLQKIYGLSASPSIRSPAIDASESAAQGSGWKRLEILVGPRVRFVLAICLSMWILNVGVAYSMNMWAPEILKILLNSKRIPYEIFMVGEAMQVPWVLAVGYFMDTLGRKPALSCSFALAATMCLILTHMMPEYWAVASAFWLMGLPWEVLWAAKIAYTQEAFATELRGTAGGICNFSGRLSGALVPIAAGWLLDHSGVRVVGAALSGLLCLASCIALLIPQETARRQIKELA